MISNDLHWLRWDEELYSRDEEWCSCIRRSVFSPCMLSIDYYCVVSVTVGDQSVRTLIKTLTISKYFVGSGANSMHTHVVGKSLLPSKLVFCQRLSSVKGKLFHTMWVCIGFAPDPTKYLLKFNVLTIVRKLWSPIGHTHDAAIINNQHTRGHHGSSDTGTPFLTTKKIAT